jgi:hypothetical protein
MTSHNAQEVWHDKLKSSSFSIQADESTDFINKSYTVEFVRSVNDGEIQENFLLQRAAQNKQKARYI